MLYECSFLGCCVTLASLQINGHCHGKSSQQVLALHRMTEVNAIIPMLMTCDLVNVAHMGVHDKVCCTFIHAYYIE
jgi:hypothetical protein